MSQTQLVSNKPDWKLTPQLKMKLIEPNPASEQGAMSKTRGHPGVSGGIGGVTIHENTHINQHTHKCKSTKHELPLEMNVKSCT